MNFGNILSALKDRFGSGIDAARLTELYNTGQLSHLLPDGCWWMAHVDESDNVHSIESIATSELLNHSPVGSSRDGGLLIKVTNEADPEAFKILMKRFPLCDAHKQFSSTAEVE